MKPRSQKIALLAHIIFSVGWVGAVVPYVALAVAGLTARDSQMARAACLSMEMIGWYVIVPFSLGALATGLLQSLGTQWGLFRYWWIIAKLLLTVFAVAVLLKHMQDVSRAARMATLSSGDFRPELLHSLGGLAVLLAALTLSVFKPWGMTRYGRRTARARVVPLPQPTAAALPAVAFTRPRWGRIIGFHAAGLVLLFAILHVTGMHHH